MYNQMSVAWGSGCGLRYVNLIKQRTSYEIYRVGRLIASFNDDHGTTYSRAKLCTVR